MEFDYFYNRDGERFSYYMLPKILVTDGKFQSLSSDAKILYACLLERTALSLKNKWIDQENRIYIIFTLEEIMEVLGRSNKTAVKVLNELDSSTGGLGLIERKKQGLGKPNIIYVKDFLSIFSFEGKNYSSEVKNLHTRSEEATLQEVKKIHGTNSNTNKHESNHPDFKFGKKSYGIFQNVFLRDEDIRELKGVLVKDFSNYVERLSAYLKSTGKTYKDHKATILSWFYKDQGNRRGIKASNIPSLEEYDKGEHL